MILMTPMPNSFLMLALMACSICLRLDFLNDFNSIYCGITKKTISEAFRHFVNLSEDDKKSLIANGIKTCEKYNWDAISDQYLDVYKNVLSEAEAKKLLAKQVEGILSM